MIEVLNLQKTFKNVAAVNHLSFSAEKGQILGFIGPNGAGKTTTIRILATLLPLSSGSAKINGHCVMNYPERVRASIGYMPDYYGTYDGIEVWEYLDFFASAYRIPRPRRKKIIADVMDLTELNQVQNKLVSTLSKGMKQRLCLAKTLVHDPQVLILDEPAAGLDPRARIELKMLVKELSKMGKTILISSHILTELADFVHAVVIIEHGELKAFGSIESIQQQLAKRAQQQGQILHLKFHGELQKAETLLKALPEILNISVKTEQNQLDVEFLGPDENIYQVLKPLVDAHLPLIGLKKEQKGLEDIFMQVTDGVVA